MTGLTLGFGLNFTDLYENAGLEKLDRRFVEWLREADDDLASRLLAARAQPEAVIAAGDESRLLIDLAPHLDDFVGGLFGIGAALRQLAARHEALTPLYAAKRLFVQRRAAKAFRPDQAADLDGRVLTAALEVHLGIQFDELTFAARVLDWLGDEPAHAAELDLATRYAAWATRTAAGKARTGMAFCSRRRARSIRCIWCRSKRGDATASRCCDCRKTTSGAREGFELTDPGMDLTARWTRRTTASGATTRARTAAPRG